MAEVTLLSTRVISTLLLANFIVISKPAAPPPKITSFLFSVLMIYLCIKEKRKVVRKKKQNLFTSPKFQFPMTGVVVLTTYDFFMQDLFPWVKN